jgi:hypothetical protein
MGTRSCLVAVERRIILLLLGLELRTLRRPPRSQCCAISTLIIIMIIIIIIIKKIIITTISSVCIATGSTARVQFPAVQDFSLVPSAKLTLGPTQPPIQWVPRAISPGSKAAGA